MKRSTRQRNKKSKPHKRFIQRKKAAGNFGRVKKFSVEELLAFDKYKRDLAARGGKFKIQKIETGAEPNHAEGLGPRDSFAEKAMWALLIKGYAESVEINGCASSLAVRSYQIADAMIAERAKAQVS